jgi:hypothetical protein
VEAMKFDDFTDNDTDLQERLSSWRRLPGVVERVPDSLGDGSINEAEVRIRQRRAASMCLNLVKDHAAFYADLKPFIEKGAGERDPNQQQRTEDMAAFALGVFEQFNAENLHQGLRSELQNLPKEVIQTIPVPAPQPPKSLFQRLLGI